jgi:hypothetical protein
LARSTENYLRWKFGRHIAQGFTPNVSLFGPSAEPSLALSPRESAVARIALADSSALILTDVRLIRDGDTLLWFDDVRVCFWIDRDSEAATKLKRQKFHWIIFELRDGREITVEGLGQAVFPMLSFFWNKLHRGPRRTSVK